jgi:two-component system, LytTR family, response regulator LytT
MENKIDTQNMNPNGYPWTASGTDSDSFKETKDLRTFFHQYRLSILNDLLETLATPSGKKSFLVFKNNKYINVHTKNIAFFYVKSELSIIMSFDRQEYFVNHSLDQIQNVLSGKQFFRLNRQYLINFNVVKEVEHYFARKLLVNPVVPTKDKLLVPREKVSEFLHWLDNR